MDEARVHCVRAEIVRPAHDQQFLRREEGAAVAFKVRPHLLVLEGRLRDDVRHDEHQSVGGERIGAIRRRTHVAAVIATRAVSAGGDGLEARRQARVDGPGVGTSAVSDIRRSQVPARPIGFAHIVIVINGLDVPLNQVMVVVIGISRRPTGVAQLHLQRSVNDGAGREDCEQQRTGGDQQC